MKLRSILLFAAVAIFSQTISQASITNITSRDDGDGAVVCPIYTWPGGDGVNIYGDQYQAPGHILFDVQTDTELDPTIYLFNSIDNDTSFVWTGYQVDIIMNKAFTLSGATVSSPVNWDVVTTQPGAPIGGYYTGTMFLSGGDPIQIGEHLDFGFSVSFLGSVSFTEQLTPVPEPTTASLLFFGFATAALLRRNRT